MSSFSKIAKLANLPISSFADYDKKLDETLKYVEILKEVDTKNIPPTAQVGSQVNITREDEIDKEKLIPAGKYQSKVTWA